MEIISAPGRTGERRDRHQ